MYKWFVMILAACLLAACGEDESATNEQPDAILQEKAVGYEFAADEVVEAASVPKEEKEALLNAFSEYIAAFNDADLDRYMAMISENPQGFDYDEDEEAAKEVFATYNVNRQAKDVTVINYEEDVAQVFANLTIDMKERATGVSLSSSGRQVTVFVKEDDTWKVTSVYFIGDETSHVSHIQ